MPTTGSGPAGRCLLNGEIPVERACCEVFGKHAVTVPIAGAADDGVAGRGDQGRAYHTGGEATGQAGSDLSWPWWRGAGGLRLVT